MLKNTYGILKYIENLSSDYEKLFNDFDRERFLKDKNYSLVQFYYRWGLERYGNTKKIKLADIKFLSKYAEKFQDDSFKKDFVNRYKEMAGNDKLNEPRNPFIFDMDKNMDTSPLSFDPRKIVQLIKENKVEEAFNLIKLKGLGHKIKSFFLRDMSLFYSYDNLSKSQEELLYLFPIDIWIKEFLLCLKMGKLAKYPKAMKYDTLSPEDTKLGFDFLDYCVGKGLDTRKINAGIWFYCAMVVGSKERLRSLLMNDDVECIKNEYDLMFKYL